MTVMTKNLDTYTIKGDGLSAIVQPLADSNHLLKFFIPEVILSHSLSSKSRTCTSSFYFDFFLLSIFPPICLFTHTRRAHHSSQLPWPKPIMSVFPFDPFLILSNHTSSIPPKTHTSSIESPGSRSFLISPSLTYPILGLLFMISRQPT